MRSSSLLCNKNSTLFISCNLHVYSCGFSINRSHGHENTSIKFPKQINNLTALYKNDRLWY